MWILTVVLFAGVLVEPFRVGDVEPGYQQVAVRVAMAPDGRFAVTWIDSTGFNQDYKLRLRSFDKDGSPITQAQEIVKLVDANYIYQPCLAMDGGGNSTLLWFEGSNKYSDSIFIRFQRFDKGGKVLDQAKTIRVGELPCTERCIEFGVNSKGEMVFAWQTLGYVWIQRYDAIGNPSGQPFIAHGSFPEGSKTFFQYPHVALSDSGDIAVTWLEAIQTNQCYPRFQVFDKNDQSILPWQENGHLLDSLYLCPNHEMGYNGTRSEVHWLDNDRFITFWNAGSLDGYEKNLVAKVFSSKGLVEHPRQSLLRDNQAEYGGPQGWYSTAVSDERFAVGYDRQYNMMIDSFPVVWQHQDGIFGRVVESYVPERTTTRFEYSPPFGADTICDADPQPPAVACNADRIVWVYSRMEPDTTWKAYALVTDWNMGVGVEQPVTPPPLVTHLEIISPIGPTVTLRYSNCPQGFRASVFDASGRKVDELQSPQTQGVIQWGGGRGYGPGVYFIVPGGASAKPLKAVIVR